MFKDKIEILYQANKNNSSAIMTIEKMLNACNDHVHNTTTILSRTETGKNKPSTAITYEKCMKYFIEVNQIAVECNLPELFPEVEISNQLDVTKKYINPLIKEYVENRRK
ncbi:MAG: hypothetical protein FWC47_05870 [Oscillospiraceae bacterium]|nr:hypothetical protein [Oscillospiraceae bacterium]